MDTITSKPSFKANDLAGNGPQVNSTASLERLIRRQEISAQCNKINYEKCLMMLSESSVDRDIFDMVSINCVVTILEFLC